MAPRRPPEWIILHSSQRHAHGGPRFTLQLGVTQLADESAMECFEGELTGRGEERLMRDLLDDVLRSGDCVVDAAPGLGMLTLSAATAPHRQVNVVAICRGSAAVNLSRQIATNRLEASVTIVQPDSDTLPPIDSVLAPCGPTFGGRRWIRLGAIDCSDDVVRALTPSIEDGSLAGILWQMSADAPNHDLAAALARQGYRHFGLTLASGDLKLDPVSASCGLSTVVSLRAECAVELATALSRQS